MLDRIKIFTWSKQLQKSSSDIENEVSRRWFFEKWKKKHVNILTLIMSIITLDFSEIMVPDFFESNDFYKKYLYKVLILGTRSV